MNTTNERKFKSVSSKTEQATEYKNVVLSLGDISIVFPSNSLSLRHSKKAITYRSNPARNEIWGGREESTPENVEQSSQLLRASQPATKAILDRTEPSDSKYSLASALDRT